MNCIILALRLLLSLLVVADSCADLLCMACVFRELAHLSVPFLLIQSWPLLSPFSFPLPTPSSVRIQIVLEVHLTKLN